MAKKINTALDELVAALRHHAAVVTDRPVSSKRAGRASAKVQEAAAAYAEAVARKTGQSNPFYDFLDPETISSLRAEHAALSDARNSKKNAK